MALSASQTKIARTWHQLFEFSVLVKFVHGASELALAAAAGFISQARISRLFYFLAGGELREDPRDAFLNFVSQLIQTFPTSRTYAVVYLLVHGVLNVFLAMELFYNRLWAYKATIVLLLIFMVSQIYRIVQHHSPVLLGITIFDAIFLVLTWHEYQYRLTKISHL